VANAVWAEVYTAEVAGSSPVVPAKHSKRVIWDGRNPKEHKKDTLLRHFCVLKTACSSRRSCVVRFLCHLPESGLEVNTNDITAACAACLAGVIARVYISKVDLNDECRNSS
jgi:hypothetical protein